MENAPLSLEYSLSELVEFLDYLADKGLVNRNTAVSRKAACNKMLSILGPGEVADLRDVDVDQLATRFGHLKGKSYSPKSLLVYKSRVSTALSDFFRYKENPANFKIGSGQQKVELTAKLRLRRSARQSGVSSKPDVSHVSEVAKINQSSSTINIPVPLRGNCVVQINGLPVDLTKAEAVKISAVVNAMVFVSE